jgi:hypothetical protein
MARGSLPHAAEERAKKLCHRNIDLPFNHFVFLRTV